MGCEQRALNMGDGDEFTLGSVCLYQGHSTASIKGPGTGRPGLPRAQQDRFFGISVEFISYLTKLHEDAYKLASPR